MIEGQGFKGIALTLTFPLLPGSSLQVYLFLFGPQFLQLLSGNNSTHLVEL